MSHPDTVMMAVAKGIMRMPHAGEADLFGGLDRVPKRAHILRIIMTGCEFTPFKLKRSDVVRKGHRLHLWDGFGQWELGQTRYREEKTDQKTTHGGNTGRKAVFFEAPDGKQP